MKKAVITYIIAGALLTGAFAYTYGADFLVRPFASAFAFETSAAAALENASTTPVRVPILIYHSVHPLYGHENAEQIRYNVTPDEFDAQLRYLRDNGYTTVTYDQLEAFIKSGTTSPVAKPVALTFDDGWQTQYHYAFPILRAHGDVATFYVYTNPISRDDRFLTWGELREMHDAGMAIGSHSVTHPYITRLGKEAMHREVFESKRSLEEHLGISVRHFAAPFGMTNSELRGVVKDAGYVTLRTTYPGVWHSQEDMFDMAGYFAPQSITEFESILNHSE